MNRTAKIVARVVTLVCAAAWLCVSPAFAQKGGKAQAKAAPRAPAQAPTLKTKSGFVTTSDGVKIHYLEAGPEYAPGRLLLGADLPNRSKSGANDPPAILFVPGWTMPADIWEKQIAYFSKMHRVVAMDPRSQGDSSKPAEGHYPAARARDIKAVVDQLKLSPVVLVGWSTGVVELAAYVDQFGTGSVAGLVLVDGVAGGPYDPTITPAMLQFASSLQKDRQKATDGFVRSMYRTPQSEDYLKRIMEASLRTPTNSAMALFLGAVTSDYRAALAKFDKPTLLVVAAGGPWMPVYEDMQKRIAGARFEKMENTGHALFADQPERFNSLFEDFLARLSQPAGPAK